MYLQYWKLKEMPFENNFDLRYLYLSQQHEEALTRLMYVVKNKRHGVVLSGGYGMGKTLLLRYFMKRLDQSKQDLQIINISAPLMTMQEFYRYFLQQLGESSSIKKFSGPGMISHLEKTLITIQDAGGHVVIIIDDANLIPKETITEMSAIVDLCNPTTQKPLMSMVLSGPYGESDTPEDVPSGALRQRLPLRCYLEMLDRDQCDEYICHRLEVAGQQNTLFTDNAVTSIAEHSKGSPRSINNICDLALFVGYSKNVVKVDVDIIETVTQEIAGSLG